MAIHVILDNYATHKHDRVRAWLKRNKRVHLHFIPTGSSWLNMVERLFSELTEKQLKRLAVPALQNSSPSSWRTWTIATRNRVRLSGPKVRKHHRQNRTWTTDFGVSTPEPGSVSSTFRHRGQREHGAPHTVSAVDSMWKRGAQRTPCLNGGKRAVTAVPSPLSVGVRTASRWARSAHGSRPSTRTAYAARHPTRGTRVRRSRPSRV